MEILDLSKHAKIYEKDIGARFELKPSQLKLVGFESKFRVVAQVHLGKEKPGQAIVTANFDIHRGDDDGRGAYICMKLPLEAFPDVAVDLKSSVKAFKLSRFSILDFAFSVLLNRLAKLTFTLQEDGILVITLKMGEHAVREVVDLNKKPDFRTALSLPSG